MIIKLDTSVPYARHKEASKARPLSRSERIKADRLVMAILFLLTIILSAVFA